jgi:hypothetical protein
LTWWRSRAQAAPWTACTPNRPHGRHTLHPSDDLTLPDPAELRRRQCVTLVGDAPHSRGIAVLSAFPHPLPRIAGKLSDVKGKRWFENHAPWPTAGTVTHLHLPANRRVAQLAMA